MIADDIETPRLLLSCLRMEHVTPAYRSWLDDSEVNQFLETRFTVPSLGSLREYVESMRASAGSCLYGIFSKDSGDHYGNIKLGPISTDHNSAAIGIVIGDRTAWGKGFASESVTALSDWAFGHLGLDKLTAGSYQKNGRSIRAFQKSGFEVEGIQRSQVRLVDGSRDGVVLLGRLRPGLAVSEE